MDFETILFEKQDGIVKLTLNRPEKLNAFNARLADEVAFALNEINHDPESRVLVLTEAGRAFCAGADVGMMLGEGK